MAQLIFIHRQSQTSIPTEKPFLGFASPRLSRWISFTLTAVAVWVLVMPVPSHSFPVRLIHPFIQAAARQSVPIKLSFPSSVIVGPSGEFFIADKSEHIIRRLDPQTGQITIIAGTGSAGFSGDRGPALKAQLAGPYALAFDGDHILLIADTTNQRIRALDLKTGIITTVAGNGQADFAGDGGAATTAALNHPFGVAVDPHGNILITDTLNHRIRRVDHKTGKISTVAGTGKAGFGGDQGPATAAQLNLPRSLIVDPQGNIFVSDLGNNRVRRIDGETGDISTIAGTGVRGFQGDDGPAIEAQLFEPSGLAWAGDGQLLIADAANHRIRRVDFKTGIIVTVAGNGAGARRQIPDGFA
ncbi:MAG TPA: hypothetical protein PKE58_15770, partial [Acidobacteriota bacterium]|nr:hypothetical protein [Acidobacteriota bacterium]